MGSLTDRLDNLLKGKTVEWVHHDSPTMLTVKFVRGPILYVDLNSTRSELEISVVDGPLNGSDQPINDP